MTSSRRWFGPWVVGLLAAWTTAWIVYQTLFAVRVPLGGWPAFWWWTGAKVLVWIVAPLWILRTEGQPPLRATGLDTARGLGRGALLLLPFLALQVGISAVSKHWPSSPRSAPAAWNACLVAPLFEEFVFRGFALNKLRRAGARFWPAATATTAAFALLHAPGWLFMNGATLSVLLSVLNVAMIGMVLAAVAWRLPSLWCAILIHAVNNAWDQGIILIAGKQIVHTVMLGASGP